MAANVKRGRGQRGTAKAAVSLGSADGDNAPTESYVVSALRQMLADPDANAPAKASAARTLAEIEGRIGRHQQAPVDRTGDRPVSALSRVELERELARLRTVCGGDTAITH